MAHKKVMTLFNYIGGKSWLREELRLEVENSLTKNSHIVSYAEPFAGGLGAFLNVYDILIEHKIQKVVLNDINTKLINFYNAVNNSPEKLIQEYMKLENAYAKCIPNEVKNLHKTKDKEQIKKLLMDANNYFKQKRNDFNNPQPSIESAAHLLFLQNHCFNGVYRENLTGNYNTPYNWEAKVFSLDKIKEKINNVHKVFQLFDITFTHQNFDTINYEKNVLYYLDPPYVNASIVENKYNKDSFDINKQKLLITKIKDVNFIYSNHYNAILLEEFNHFNPKVKVKAIARKNIISASVESRKSDKIEMLVSRIL